ncbi:MAG TPA: hypothetical protein PKA41_17290 [Verrucomicrobiota bacterium]|nr:hypothetical protein [Verrucomicrobiota bacterium]
MKTWKSKRRVCRSRKTGRFARRKKCGAFKSSLVKLTPFGSLFK